MATAGGHAICARPLVVVPNTFQLFQLLRQHGLRALLTVTIGGGFAFWGVVRWRDFQAIFDDSYISFRYADNLARGLGLVYNPGERVEGYTNFFWVLLEALGIRFGLHPLQVAVSMGVAAYAGCAILCAACWVTTGARLGPKLCALPLIACLILPPGVAQIAGSGLETFFVAFLSLATGILAHRINPQRPAQRLGIGALMLLLFLTRMDSAIFIGASGLVSLASEAWQRQRLRTSLFRLFTLYGPFALGAAAYMAWRLNYYGDWFPNTYYAKHSAAGMPADAGITYLRAFIRSCPWIVTLAPFVVAAPLTRSSVSIRTFSVYGLLSTVAWVLYVNHVGGDFMQYRFMWVALPLFLATALLGVLNLRSTAVALATAALSLSLSPLPTVLEKKYGQQTIRDMNLMARQGVVVGKALRQLPSNTTISTTLAGTISYYSRLTTIDQWGLNDRYVARRTTHHFGRGHVKYAPVEYLRKRKVNLVLGHPKICSWDSPCFDGRANVFIRIDPTRAVRAWYLTQNSKLTRYLCQRPTKFKLSCPPRPLSKKGTSSSPSVLKSIKNERKAQSML